MRAKLIVLSVVATGCGWAVASLLFVVNAAFVWRSLADVALTLWWTAFFSFLGWLVAFVPIIMTVRPDNRIFALPFFTLVGALVGPFAFFILVGWWAPLWRDSVVYLLFPATMGAVAGGVYSILLKRAV